MAHLFIQESDRLDERQFLEKQKCVCPLAGSQGFQALRRPTCILILKASGALYLQLPIDDGFDRGFFTECFRVLTLGRFCCC